MARLRATIGGLTGLVLTGIGATASSRAAEINVDNTWTYQEINNILDGNAGTTGKDGQIDAQYGDIVRFAPGTYQLPMIQNAWYKVRVDGVTLDGAGWGENGTRIYGASPNSGRIFEIFSRDVTLSDFEISNSYAGVSMGGNDYENIYINNLKSIGHYLHYTWQESNAAETPVAPSIMLDGCYLIEGHIGMHFGEIEGATLNTKYLGAINITAENVNGLVVDAPRVGETFLGNDDINDSVIIGGTPFREDLYGAMNSPCGMVEWEIYVDSLADRGIGEFNIEADPMLDENGVPMLGSPAIGPQYAKGYAGALPPAQSPPFRLPRANHINQDSEETGRVYIFP